MVIVLFFLHVFYCVFCFIEFLSLKIVLCFLVSSCKKCLVSFDRWKIIAIYKRTIEHKKTLLIAYELLSWASILFAKDTTTILSFYCYWRMCSDWVANFFNFASVFYDSFLHLFPVIYDFNLLKNSPITR